MGPIFPVQCELHGVITSFQDPRSPPPKSGSPETQVLCSQKKTSCAACQTGAYTRASGGKEREHSNLWGYVSWLSAVRAEVEFTVGTGCENTDGGDAMARYFNFFRKGFLHHLLGDYAESVP